ncbi:MAG: adenine deaminase [Methanoregulaceae archaeon]|nr:adenine deaminase [Methanoregulaceae archaeon]
MSGPDRRALLPAALGDEPADHFFSGAEVFNPFTCEWEQIGFAVSGGYVVGLGQYRGRESHDLSGKRIVPGLIDAHVHIESSLLGPAEYARLVSSRGTTTVIADPHEIANVCGTGGIDWILDSSQGLPVDIFLMLPSCVPATPLDKGGAEIRADDLSSYIGREGVIGLGEMMNVPGVLAGDPGVWAKLGLTTRIDGHAPLLSGPPLNAYILAGMQSDHECTNAREAGEKLRRGMFLFIREGSTERNVRELAKVVTAADACRCAFATDDRHADMLASKGHIDDCIRVAIAAGIEPELAFRMATLSPAQRFGLHDRGAIAPGMLADFCIVNREFGIEATYKRGRPTEAWPVPVPAGPAYTFRRSIPEDNTIRLSGEGLVHVIGLVPGQILTRDLLISLALDRIPDLSRDVLKVVVCSRYRETPCGAGLVNGFGFRDGAIACSISHDSHNIIAAGVHDKDIMGAIGGVIRHRGALVAVSGKRVTTLPLRYAGLMSDEPWEKVVAGMERLKEHTDTFGGIENPFMYLTFLALTVIPELRVTERGPFDAQRFADIPLCATQGGIHPEKPRTKRNRLQE